MGLANKMAVKTSLKKTDRFHHNISILPKVMSNKQVRRTVGQ